MDLLKNMQSKLSIITINRNNADGLRKTIESVVNQTYTDFEYIVIDGASTDESVEIIKQHDDRITYWVSEPDKGIYNAMNKGILKANGEYCLFLNSGDWLVDEKVIMDFYSSGFDDDIVSGNLINWDEGKTFLKVSIERTDLSYENFFYDTTLPHQATFIKKKLFSKYGLYNENNKLVSDWEFFFTTLVIYNCSYNHFDREISFYDLSGISSQKEAHVTLFEEREAGLKKHLPLVYKSFTSKLNKIESLESDENKYKHYYNEYMSLKKGKFSLIIRTLLYVKRLSKQRFKLFTL